MICIMSPSTIWVYPLRSDQDRKPPPYQPLYCHHYWFINIRYLVKLEGQWVYSLCIVEGYSRKILAGMASDYQNDLAVLQFPRTVNQHGCVSVQRFYIYAERGLAKHGVAVWIYDEEWLKVRPRPPYTPRKPQVPLPHNFFPSV